MGIFFYSLVWFTIYEANTYNYNTSFSMIDDNCSSFSALCKKAVPNTFSTNTRAMDVVLSGLKAWMDSNPWTAFPTGPVKKQQISIVGDYKAACKCVY